MHDLRQGHWDFLRSGETAGSGIDSEKDFIGRDFRSEISKEFLTEADIVVTNPPFSLFREYFNLLMEHGKQFLIIGNMNAVAYINVFLHIMKNQVSLRVLKKFGFNTPDKETETMCNVRWFTNLDLKNLTEPLELTKRYDPVDYPKYDNYDAIEVSKVKDIPVDYDGIMGVPITFLDRHNPDQFRIIGMAEGLDRYNLKTKRYTRADLKNCVNSNTRDLNKSAIILLDGKFKPLYHRILIRRADA